MTLFHTAEQLHAHLVQQTPRVRYMITDPPYMGIDRKSVSKSPGKGVVSRDLGFDTLSTSLPETLLSIADQTEGGVIFSSDRGCGAWHDHLTARGFRCEVSPWIRWSMPQLSGDRPPTGSEWIVWYGDMAQYCRTMRHKCLRGRNHVEGQPGGKHPAQKPSPLIADLLPHIPAGATVIDPCCGSGVVPKLSKWIGLGWLAAEVDPYWYAHCKELLQCG